MKAVIQLRLDTMTVNATLTVRMLPWSAWKSNSELLYSQLHLQLVLECYLELELELELEY